MKKLLFLGILFFIGLIGKTQRVYFIYLQSENAIPFYVKMGDKIHSSSTAGYMILSNLKDSVYSISVGLAGKQQSEPRFKITIANGDRGFLIKELDQKLSLFDFHSMEVVAPVAAVDLRNEDYVTRTDNFTRTLSQSANDPSLLQEVIRKEPIKDVAKVSLTQKEEKRDSGIQKEPVSVVSKTIDTLIASTNTKVTDYTKSDSTLITSAPIIVDTVNSVSANNIKKGTDEKENQVIQEVESKTLSSVSKVEEPQKEAVIKDEERLELDLEYKRSVIVRRSESSTSEGFGLTFIDFTTTGNDTIRLLIPNPKVPYNSVSIVSKEESPALNTKEIQNDISTLTIPIDSIKKENICNLKASEGDFRRLRKEMAAQDSDAEMISKAKYVFQMKCFTTEQIKNLSTLFLTPESKYSFFEVSIKQISDMENASVLQQEIKDEYYSRLLKALIAK